MIEVYLNPDKGAVLGFRIKKNRTITEWGDLSVDERARVLRHMEFILNQLKRERR